MTEFFVRMLSSVSPHSPSFPSFRLVFNNILPADTYGSRGKSINTVTRYNFQDRDLIPDKCFYVLCGVETGYGAEPGTHVLCTGKIRPEPEAHYLTPPNAFRIRGAIRTFPHTASWRGAK